VKRKRPDDRNQIFERMLCNHKENILLTKSLGEGLGYNFLSLKTVQQEELFQKVKNYKDFAEGFGNSIGQIYDRFDSILQLQILKFIGGTKEFDRRFAYQIGNRFPSLNHYIRKEILQKISKTETTDEFTDYFITGVMNSFKYLEIDSQNELRSILLQKKPQFVKKIQEM